MSDLLKDRRVQAGIGVLGWLTWKKPLMVYKYGGAALAWAMTVEPMRQGAMTDFGIYDTGQKLGIRFGATGEKVPLGQHWQLRRYAVPSTRNIPIYQFGLGLTSVPKKEPRFYGALSFPQEGLIGPTSTESSGRVSKSFQQMRKPQRAQPTKQRWNPARGNRCTTRYRGRRCKLVAGHSGKHAY